LATIIYVQPDGREMPTQVRTGSSVMLGAIQASVPGIEAECGGALDCATCHVYVHPDWLARLSPLSDDEDALLDGVAAERRPESRLSCQLNVTDALDGLIVQLPDRQC